MEQKFQTELQDHGIRVDKYLSEKLEGFTRSYIQKLIKEERVKAAGQVVKANYTLGGCEELTISIPEQQEPDIAAEDIPLDILYEDEDVILINKPKGMVVHPAAGHYSGTLVNALMYHCRDSLSGINGMARPGIVHRIDMDTTGVLIACKNDMAHQHIAAQLKDHTITRRYHAIVQGNLKEDEGTVDAPIGRKPNDRKKMAINHKNGKEAVTHWKVQERYGDYTYVECRLETGRTHQIRVHMASVHHPLLGDWMYSSGKNSFGLHSQALHARVLGFMHPRTGEYMEFEAPLPEYFEQILNKMRKN